MTTPSQQPQQSGPSTQPIQLQQSLPPTQPIQLPASGPPTQPIQPQQSLPPTQPIQLPASGPPTQLMPPLPPPQSLTSPSPPSVMKPKERAKLLGHPLTVALITIIIGTLTTLALQWAPSEITLRQIMDQETQIAKGQNGVSLESIYDPQAVVTDSGCSSHTQGTVWAGLQQIRARYSSLSSQFQFPSLEHFDPHFTWQPNSLWATRADVSASTVGTMLSRTDGTSQILGGYERWTFTKTDTGQWLIISFTFDLCLPS